MQRVFVTRSFDAQAAGFRFDGEAAEAISALPAIARRAAVATAATAAILRGITRIS